jgi:hypothetical protein
MGNPRLYLATHKPRLLTSDEVALVIASNKGSETLTKAASAMPLPKYCQQHPKNIAVESFFAILF